MASRNQIALDEGRITQRQFDDMAVYKFRHYDNWEDLDVERDYSRYDIVKWYPVIGFDTKDGRQIVSPRGFVKYMMALCNETDYDLDDIVDQFYPGDDYINFTYRNLGWTWIDDRCCSVRDKMDQMIKYTFGGWCNQESPLAKYCGDYTELYE